MVLVAAAVLALSACGSKAPAQAPSSRIALSTFTNQAWGFELGYPANWTRTIRDASSSASENRQYQVLVADPGRAVVGEMALDVLQISVFKMGATAKAGDLKKHRKHFEAIAAELPGKPPDLNGVQPFQFGSLGCAARAHGAVRLPGQGQGGRRRLLPDPPRQPRVLGRGAGQSRDLGRLRPQHERGTEHSHV